MADTGKSLVSVGGGIAAAGGVAGCAGIMSHSLAAFLAGGALFFLGLIVGVAGAMKGGCDQAASRRRHRSASSGQ